MRLIFILMMLASLPLMADQPPYQRNNLDTNLVAAAPADGWFLVSTGSVPVWTRNGGTLTNLVGVAVNVNSNAVAVTNGQLVTISGVTDTNAVNGLLGAATNGAINNLSNYVNTVNAKKDYTTVFGTQLLLSGVGSTARYISLNGFGGGASSTTEANCSQVSPAGTYTNLFIRFVALGTSTNMTITLMTNGVASNLAASVNGNGANVIGSDTSDFTPVPSQCTVSLRIVGNNPSAPANTVFLYTTVQFFQ